VVTKEFGMVVPLGIAVFIGLQAYGNMKYFSARRM